MFSCLIHIFSYSGTTGYLLNILLIANGRCTRSQVKSHIFRVFLLMSCPAILHLPNKSPGQVQHKLGWDIYTLPTPVESATKLHAKTCTCIILFQRRNEGLGTKIQSIPSFQRNWGPDSKREKERLLSSHSIVSSTLE